MDAPVVELEADVEAAEDGIVGEMGAANAAAELEAEVDGQSR